MSVETILAEEITEEIGELGKMTLGDEEYQKTVSGVTQLTDRLIKFKELQVEAERIAVEETKAAMEEQRLAEEREDRKVKNRIAVASIAVPAGITAVGAAVMFILEGKGVIFPTQCDRNFISRIFKGR